MNVTYIDHMGSDLSVVNAARVSFKKTSTELTDADERLIDFLARGCTQGDWNALLAEAAFEGEDYLGGYPDEFEDFVNHIRRMPPHWTPFAHTSICLHVKVPIFIARQLHKHQAGFVVNEVSRRYVTDQPEFFDPTYWRAKARNVKQGSSNEEVRTLRMQGFGEQSVNDGVLKHQMHSLDLYRDMLAAGVCPEQARMILPQSMYTEFRMTGNLYGWVNLFNQRSDRHAQREIQDVAQMIGDIIEPLYPVSWKALTQ